jgi:NAD(P)-dependent dehydrogenase (short-subunit alcohol dehydrogenase family)
VSGLVIEMTDGTLEYNADHYRLSTFYDLAKTSVIRLAFAQGKELAPHGCTAVALTPGWMRSATAERSRLAPGRSATQLG